MGFFTSGLASGGLAGGASAIGTALSGATAGIGGAAAALGAVALPLGALAVVAGLFSKKVSKTTKELDSGVSGVVKGLDVTISNFKLLEDTVTTSRFFGLSKKTKVSTRSRSRRDADSPIIGAVGEVQDAVAMAARTLGFGADVFEDFSYKFKLSLKGLSEEQAQKKITEELSKMGDQFASLVPGMKGFNELLQAANEAVARAGSLGSTRFESQMLAAAARRGEITTVGAGAGGARGEDLIRLRSMDMNNKTTADNTARQNALMERLLRIWERFEIDGVPQGPVVS